MYIIILALLVILYFMWRRPEGMTDEKTVDQLVSEVRAQRPELVPIETIYIDPNGSSRFMFLNTDTYAGEVIDFSKTAGVVKNVQGINEKPNLYDYIRV